MNSRGRARNFAMKRFLLGWLAAMGLLLAACNEIPPSLPATEVGDRPTVSPAARASPGVGQVETRTPAATATASSEPEIDPTSLRGVSIQFWHIWAGAAGDELQRLVAEFNTANEWGIEVESVYQGNLDQMNSSVQTALAGGAAPDILVGYHYQALAWDGLRELVDLSGYVSDPLWGLSPEEQESFYHAFWEQDVFDGKRVGVPAQRSGQALYYNVSWAREMGFSTPPVNAEQFRQQACAAAQANRQDADPGNDGSGGYILSTHYSAMMGWIAAFGGEAARPEGGYQFDAPAVEESFHFLRELYDSGCAWLTESDPPENEFANRQGLFMAGSVANIPHQVRTFERAGNGDEWTVIPFPSTLDQPAISVYGPSFALVTSIPERQLASWLFVRWLLAPQNQARLVEETGSYPLSASSLEYLEAYQSNRPQWAAAVELLPAARSEPALQSWSLVRWAVYDAATQLFRYYFSIEQVPDLVKLLDQTAEDLDSGLSTGFAPSASPTPSVSVTPAASSP